MKDIEKIINREEMANIFNNIQNSYIVDSGIMPLIRSIPIIGDMISSATNKAVKDFQSKKQQELIDYILENETPIMSDMVNNVEFIINLSKSIDAVNRLATNDKVKYFGNLLRNGYFREVKIEASVFEDFSNIINILSYKEIMYLSFIKRKSNNGRIGTTREDWNDFCDKFCAEFKTNAFEVFDIFTRLKRTGFIREIYVAQEFEIINRQIQEMEIDNEGYTLNHSFEQFCDYVLNIK